ncbi:MAG: hypothetical protein JXB50_12110 [Spirochaetes bacterium]|nr:hypothetical protein [Spirochaetota bacterium]
MKKNERKSNGKKLFEIGYYSHLIKNGAHEYKTQLVLAEGKEEAEKVFTDKVDCRGIACIKEFTYYIE